MYFARNYSASSAVEADRTFLCLGCGFRCPAFVAGFGTGSASSPYMMANEGAELAAVTEAAEAAEANAEQALLLTGCPRCGVVNPVARREHGIGTFFRATLAALGGAVVGLIVARTMSAHSVTAPVLLSGGVGAAIAVFVRRRQCAALRDQVMLFPDRAPSDDLSMI